MKIRNRNSIFRRIMRRVGLQLFQRAENNDDARMSQNGEAWFLRALVKDWAIDNRLETRTVIDAGANQGEFTAMVLDASSQAGVQVRVHAIEPGPSAAVELGKRFAIDPRVVIANTAVSDFEGAARLFNSSDASTLASLVQRTTCPQGKTVEVPVTTLAAFLDTSGVRRVDLLKLDVEGAELSALRGLGNWLDPVRVSTIQFEYGGTTLDAGHRLRDFFELVEAKGYRLAKLFPGWLELRTYAPWMDSFNYSNWVAIDANRSSRARQD